MAITIEKKIFLTPYWIVDAIERNHLALNSILELDILFNITSPNDLASLSLLNSNTSRIFGKDVQLHSMMHWNKNVQALKRYLDQIEPLKAIVCNELEERLYDKSSKQERYPDPFCIKDIDNNVLLVIIYPGFFGNDQSAQYQSDITKAILKLLYAYEGYDNMARKDIFEKYLEQL